MSLDDMTARVMGLTSYEPNLIADSGMTLTTLSPLP